MPTYWITEMLVQSINFYGLIPLLEILCLAGFESTSRKLLVPLLTALAMTTAVIAPAIIATMIYAVSVIN